MIDGLSLKQRQFLAVAILAIFMLFVLVFLIKPFLSSYMSYGETIESLEQQVQTFQRLAQGMEQTEADLEKLKQNNPAEEFYLPESKPALAAAELQQYLSSVIRRSGGQVVSTKILNQTNDTPLLSVAIQVHLRLEIEQLVPLLHRIESGKPMLFINNFSVAANVRKARLSRQQRLQQQRKSSQNQTRRYRKTEVSRPFDVRFDLIGYAVKEPAI